jgi:hypothetical protein
MGKNSVFGSLFGGILGSLDPEEILKGVATKATASVAKGPLSKAFQGMKVEGRGVLAGKLEQLAGHLRKGECDAAAGVGADIIDDIKL